MFKFLPILLLISCAPLREDNFMAPWIGLPVAELAGHSYFSRLPPRIIQRSAIKKTVEYFEQDGYKSKIECEQIGGCVGLQYLRNCSYEFEVESTIILSATLHGRCKKDPRLLPEK